MCRPFSRQRLFAILLQKAVSAAPAIPWDRRDKGSDSRCSAAIKPFKLLI
jgi:hypothetical protein